MSIFQALGAGKQGNAPLKSGKIDSQLSEWFIGQNSNSAEGQQRVENEKARQHATSERTSSQQYNTLEAQKNRDWQQMMSDTSYQRTMNDMQKAGLNPLLAYDQGGASTPSGATAHSSASPSSANSTKDSDPIGSTLKLLSLVMQGVNYGASIAQKSTASVSQIASQEAMNIARISSAEKINALRTAKASNFYDKAKINSSEHNSEAIDKIFKMIKK